MLAGWPLRHWIPAYAGMTACCGDAASVLARRAQGWGSMARTV